MGRRKPFIVIALVLACFPCIVFSQTLTDPQLRARVIVSGLDTPTTMAFLGTNDILVLEKETGNVRRVVQGVLQHDPVFHADVDDEDEHGMIGIVVHPQFPATPSVYLYYSENTAGGTSNRIDRLTWNGHALTNGTQIASLPGAYLYHNGGVMTFGSDGKLYAVIGDQNQYGLFQNSATNTPDAVTSAIVRLNDDGSIPSDNPFFGLGGVFRSVFAYGVRNSFGLAFDPVTGQLWDTENGNYDSDEINHVEPGFNSGWRNLMGPASRDAQGTNDLVMIPGSHYTDPKFTWITTVAPTGIAFLNSTNLGAQYENDAFVGDFNTGTLYRFTPNESRDGFTFTDSRLADLVADSSGELDEVVFGTGFGGISDVKVGPDGKLYLVSIDEGEIFVLEPALNGPDLAATWRSTGPKQKCKGAGETLACKLKGAIRIQNNGNELAASTAVRFFVSEDAAWDAGDAQLGDDVGVREIKPGASRTVKLKATLPSGSSASGKYLLAVLDAGHTVDETDETNNTIVSGPLP